MQGLGLLPMVVRGAERERLAMRLILHLLALCASAVTFPGGRKGWPSIVRADLAPVSSAHSD